MNLSVLIRPPEPTCYICGWLVNTRDSGWGFCDYGLFHNACFVESEGIELD